MSDRRPILVTGSHRSGTGWVGSMIAASPAPPVAYLWEPFSILHRPGILDVRFPHWFPYVCTQNEEAYVAPVRDMLKFTYRTGVELQSVRSPKDGVRLVRDRARFAKWRRQEARPLLKDPIAVYSAGWLADTFDMDVIVLIRHPAAFVNSIVGRGLRHPFDHFLRQPLLMHDVLSPFAAEISRFADAEQPLLDQGILLWNLLHSPIARYRQEHPSWSFLRLEDIAAEPDATFRALYDRLGLVYNGAVYRTVAEHSGTGNPAEDIDPTSHKRDSAASIVAWKGRLASTDVDRIRAGVEPLSVEFYADEDW
ncbi:MAG: sulfotransferase [Actinomycetota bacterium]